MVLSQTTTGTVMATRAVVVTRGGTGVAVVGRTQVPACWAGVPVAVAARGQRLGVECGGAGVSDADCDWQWGASCVGCRRAAVCVYLWGSFKKNHLVYEPKSVTIDMGGGSAPPSREFRAAL